MAIQVTCSAMPSLEEYIEEIRPMWESHWLTNNGEKLKELENKLKERLGVPYVALFTNGHLALEALLKVSSLHGEVITTPFSFASTTHAIVRAGLTPVFCDVKAEDGTMDPDLIEALITEKTCAILPVHVYGNVCDVEKIDAIAKLHNLPVYYDAAHAFNVKYKQKGIATFGNASMFSFHATKVFHSIEGGAIATDSKELYDALALERNFGIEGPEDIIEVGGNAKMNEFQAAMGLCNLRRLESDIAMRKNITLLYKSNLQDLDNVILPATPENTTENFAYYPVRFKGGINMRDNVFEYLATQNIHARKYFYPLINDYECYVGRKGFSSENTPVARKWANGVLTLPIYPDLSVENVKTICDAIKSALLMEGEYK